MPLAYTPVIISSVDHLTRFSDIQRASPWWRILLGLNKLPADFPRVYLGGNAIQVNFFAKGDLHFFERQLAFEAQDPGFDNGQRYAHVDQEFRFAFPYTNITRVGRYELAEPFSKRFNINWVSLRVEAPNTPTNLLLSLTGSGTQMARINQTNEVLYRELQARVLGR